MGGGWYGLACWFLSVLGVTVTVLGIALGVICNTETLPERKDGKR